jgi:type IV secretion system protein VirB4
MRRSSGRALLSGSRIRFTSARRARRHRKPLYTRFQAIPPPEIPRQDLYENSLVENTVTDRIAFLESNADFRRIELFWAVTIEPDRKNSFCI